MKKVLVSLHSLQGGGAEMAMKNLVMNLGSEYDFRRLGVFKSSNSQESNGEKTPFYLLRNNRRRIKLKSFVEAGIKLRREIIGFGPDLLVINCEAAEALY